MAAAVGERCLSDMRTLAAEVIILLFLFTSLARNSSCRGARCELVLGMVSRCTCRRFSVGRCSSAGQTDCVQVAGVCTLSCQMDSVPSVGGTLAGPSAT